MDIYQNLQSALGLAVEPKDLNLWQVGLRAIIVFVVSLVLVRLANRRFLAKLSAFDAILGFMLASMLARAINGSGPFFPTLAGGLVLVGLHRLLAAMAFRSAKVGEWVKGEAEALAREGKVNPQAMRKHRITEPDLLEAARLNGNVADLNDIQLATMERNGHVSIIPKK